MKIAVTATGPDLEAKVDPRFGRCQYFLCVDTDDMSFEAVENSNISLGSGAGIQSAQVMAERGIQCVLTGNCGPNAFQVLSAAGIKVVTGVSGKVQDAVRDYKAGKYHASSQPNVSGHWGTGRGMD